MAVVSDVQSGAMSWGRYHALVIGINAYEKWRPLRTAVKDAAVLHDTLVGRYGFDENNVVLLIDEEATRGRIIRELRYLAGALDAEDNLLIYYAGHGQLDDLTGDGYWIPVEGALKDSSTWVSNSILKGVLSSTRVDAKNVVVIADSCYSGSLLRDGPSMLSVDERDYTEKLAKAAALRSRQVISSGGVEPVADGGRDGHSLFAYYFLKALAENDREVIDLENLFHTRVWAPVTQIGDQRPSVGRLKTPMDEDGQFVLTNRAKVQEIAAVRAAEAEQAAQQKAQLAALMAEKEKLEADRKHLAYEKQLLEERKKLDAERLEIEREKQRLEMERLEAERTRLEAEKAKAATRQAAGSSASTRHSSMTLSAIPAKTKTTGRLGLAVFSPSISDPSFSYFTDEGYLQSVENAIEPHRRIYLGPVYKPAAASTKGVSGLSLDDDENASLWKKESFFSSLEIDPDSAVRVAERAGADLALVSRLNVGSGMTLDAYLIDVRNRRVLSEKNIDSSWVSWKGDLEKGWTRLLKSYLRSAN